MLLCFNSVWAKEINNTNIVATGAHGDIFISDNGTRYVYFSPHPTFNATQIFVSPGQRILMHGINTQNLYTYSAPVIVGALYTNYLADSAFASGSAKLTAVTAARETATIVQHVQNRIANVFSGGGAAGYQVAWGSGKSLLTDQTEQNNQQTGMSSGDMMEDVAYGIWLEGGYSRIKDTNIATEFKADLYDGTIGFDATVCKNMLLGIAYTYGDIGNGKTEYNRGTIDQETHAITPYFAYRIDDVFSMDALVGYTHAKKKLTRTFAHIVGTTVVYDVNAAKVTAKANSNRVYAGIFGNAQYSPMEALNMKLRLGFTYLHDSQNEYTESTEEVIPGISVTLGQFSARLRAEYAIHNMIQPFIQGGFEHDSTLTKFSFTHGAEPSSSKSGYMLGGGINAASSDGFIGSVEFTHNFGHGGVRITSIAAKVRYEF